MPFKIQDESRKLLFRSYKICNSWKSTHIEFQTISKLLSKNGCPINFISSQIRKFLNSKHTNNDKISVLNRNDEHNIRPIFLYLPFNGNPSIHFEKELKSFFHHKLENKVKLIFIHKTFSIGQMFKCKDPQALLRRSNVIYRLSCSCSNSYIGQTRRNLASCLQEQDPSSKKCDSTDVTKHLLENPSHTIDFRTPGILATGHNAKDLLIKETLLIQKNSPSINVDESSIPLHVFNN